MFKAVQIFYNYSFTQKDFDAKYGCPPTFMKKMENIYSPEGKNAKFECKVMGIPEPTVTWYKNDKPLTPGSHYWINRDGGTCTLTVRDVMSSDTGQYTCKISNPAGETTCAAALNLDSMKVKEKSHDTEYSPFARRLSRDSIKSDHDAIPTLPYDKPSLTDIREESIRLSWLPAYTSSLPPEARNVKYVIEARELPGFDWHKVATGIHGNTHMLKNLKPNQEYAFRVHAENQYGASDSTQPAMLSRPKPAIEDEVMEKFYVKPHESRAPPKLPSTKPFVTEMGQETMRLAWKPAVAPIAAKKVAPISYRLEAQELPSTDWMPMANRLRDTSYYLPELKSDRDYNIRVRAENKYGQSEPSEPLWVPRATSFPGVPVTRPRIIEMEPDSVRVTWQKVEIPSFSADEEPLMYMLEMQEPPKPEWRQIARDIPDTSYMVRGLKPGQDYRFRVKARTPRGMFGEASPATSLYRTLATTRIPIDRLELEDTEPDFEGVRLSWNRVDIPPYHVDDQPLMYMVEMNEPPIDEWRPVVSGLPTTRYRVTDLLPDRDYRFRVRAVTPYGISPPSHTLPVSYRRPLPGPSRPLPEMPQLLYDDSDALKLSWKPPFIDTKRPLKYQVQMQAPQSQDWRPLASGISDTSYRIRGLGPSRDYTFRVIPETSLGPLQAMPPVSLTALPAPRTILPRRPDISDLQPESLRLTWKRPLIDSAVPLTYKIDIQEPPSREWRPIASNVPDTQYYVKGLRPNRDYLFRVTPSTPSYSMEPLPYVTLSSMPVRPNLYSQEPRAIEIGKDAVQLSWRPAEVPHFARQYHPLRYNVEMRTLPGSDWTIAARNLQETTYLVKGLRPEKEYQFRIRAQTDFGSSEPSLPVTIYRKTVPVFPRREPILTNLNSDSVVLSWQPATIPGSVSHMPFVTYRIEVQDPPEIGHWRTYISSIPKTSYHVTNLRPDRDYLFRVRAEADGIATEPSLPVYLSRRACPPRMPQEQPYVFELRPESVKLQWRSVELPTRITDYSPVTYRLEIQESPRMEWMTLARGIPHTDFHVTNLNPDKDYRFRVRAENDMGISDPTPEVSIRKRAVPPSMPQEEPLIYDIGPSGFWLSWRPADLTSYQSDSPVTYTIYIQEPPSSTWRPLVRRIPHAFYHVTNLRNDRDYNFRIQAENEFGLSRPTLPLKLFGCKEWKAPIDLPEITDIDESTRSLRLKWHPKPLAPFDKEAVRYHVESWEPKQRSWKSIAKGIPDTSFKVTGLPLEQDHLFRIRAEAEKVLSEPTYPISLNRFRLPAHFPIPRPQLYDVEPDAVRLSWQPTDRTNLDKPISLPKRYRLELRELPSLNWRPVAHDIPDTSYRITGLKPKQDYEFRVQGLADKGPSAYTAPISLYRRPVIPRIPVDGPRIVDVKDDYVDLRWRLVDIPSFSHSEEPLAFLIEAQTPPRYDWTPVARNVAGTSYRVQNLQRHQDYVFRVRAEYPSGLSEPSPYIPVYRRPSELIPCHGSALTALTSSHNVLVVAPLVSTNKISPAINSKKEYFLREMARLDKQRKEFNEKLHKIKSNAIKPLTSTKSLKEKFIADMAMTAKPPPSPRSRRDKFLIDKKSSATKIQPVEKKVDFGKALDKFRVLEASFGPAKPTLYRRDYSQSTGRSVDSSLLPRRLSLDSRVPIKTLALSSTLSSVHDTKMPSKHISPPRPRKSFVSTDDSFLGSRRSMSYSTTDVSYKKRHLVPDRLKYGQMSTDLSYKKLVKDYEFIPKSSYKPTSSFHKDTPLYDSKYKSFERKYYFPRPHSWAGRDITSKSAYTKYGNKYASDIYSSTSHRRSSVSTYRPRDYRKGSLSLIGQSIYHDRYAHSSSMHTPTDRSASYDVERRARSFSREMSVISKYDYGGQSTRKYSTSSLSRDRSSSSTHTDLGRSSSKYTSSSLSRDRISSSVGPNFGGSRRYSMSTDIYSVRSGYDKTRDWSFSPDRYSTTISGVSAHSPVRSTTRSPSRAPTRSPSRAKTFDSLSQRSGSIPESGYMSRTSSLPHNSYLPSRSSSVTQTILSRSGSTTGSVTDSPLRLKPRSSSAILIGLPPMSKITPSSSKKKDVSVSYTSYLPPTKQSLAQKAKSGGSRDSLLSADSSPSRMTRTSTPTKSTTPYPPGRDSTPTKGRDLTPVRICTASTSSTGSEKKVKKSSHTSKRMESADKHAIHVEPPKVQVEESVDEEKLAWLHAPSSHTIKHLA